MPGRGGATVRSLSPAAASASPFVSQPCNHSSPPAPPPPPPPGPTRGGGRVCAGAAACHVDKIAWGECLAIGAGAGKAADVHERAAAAKAGEGIVEGVAPVHARHAHRPRKVAPRAQRDVSHSGLVRGPCTRPPRVAQQPVHHFAQGAVTAARRHNVRPRGGGLGGQPLGVACSPREQLHHLCGVRGGMRCTSSSGWVGCAGSHVPLARRQRRRPTRPPAAPACC